MARPAGRAGEIFPTRLVGLILLCAAGLVLRAENRDPTDPIDHWLQAQSRIRSWSADFTQTRSLKALARPLTTSGRVWFQAPNRFRWELGSPPQTIALRLPESLYLVYPRLGRAEEYPLTADAAAPWRTALTLFEAGFPKDRTDLESVFRIVSRDESDGALQIELQPRRSTARRWMKSLSITLDAGDYSLRATAVEFNDGSTLRNAFSNPHVNPEIDPALFRAEFGDEIRIVAPARR